MIKYTLTQLVLLCYMFLKCQINMTSQREFLYRFPYITMLMTSKILNWGKPQQQLDVS